MRSRLIMLALCALALFIAVPSTLARPSSESSDKPAGKGQAAERLIKAADRFDSKAAKMTKRAAYLRGKALELRREAATLGTGAGDGAPGDDPSSSGLMLEDGSGADEPRQGSCGDGAEQPESEGFGGDRGEGDEGDEAPNACQLIKAAERFERRATMQDRAAKRMAGHAERLRAKAATMLTSDGKHDASKLLARAKEMRAKATKHRAMADEMRESAFAGDSVDEDSIEEIKKLELKAARFDLTADRLEARAAKMAAA